MAPSKEDWYDKWIWLSTQYQISWENQGKLGELRYGIANLWNYITTKWGHHQLITKSSSIYGILDLVY